MMATNPDRTYAFMTHISIYQEGMDHLREDVFKYLINKIKETEIPHLNFNITKDYFQAERQYLDMGIKFENMYQYEIEL